MRTRVNVRLNIKDKIYELFLQTKVRISQSHFSQVVIYFVIKKIYASLIPLELFIKYIFIQSE